MFLVFVAISIVSTERPADTSGRPYHTSVPSSGSGRAPAAVSPAAVTYLLRENSWAGQCSSTLHPTSIRSDNVVEPHRTLMLNFAFYK
jgi:hypothetical protein